MSEIHAGAWIGVGTVVIIASLLIPQLIAFIVVGIGFLIFGVGKIIVAKKRNPGPARPAHTYHTNDPYEARKASNANNPKPCYLCGARNNAQANYCGHCGHKLNP